MIEESSQHVINSEKIIRDPFYVGVNIKTVRMLLFKFTDFYTCIRITITINFYHFYIFRVGALARECILGKIHFKSNTCTINLTFIHEKILST